MCSNLLLVKAGCSIGSPALPRSCLADVFEVLDIPCRMGFMLLNIPRSLLLFGFEESTDVAQVLRRLMETEVDFNRSWSHRGILRQHLPFLAGRTAYFAKTGIIDCLLPPDN